MSAPPRLLRRLLARLLPQGAVRDGMVGDLDELHAERVRRDGPLRADLWYARQVAVAAARYLPRRVARFGTGPTDGLGREIRIAMRSLLRAPGLAATIVAVLGLGIGGTAAVFTVARAVLIEPLPYSEAGRLVRIYMAEKPATTDDRQYVTGSHFLAYRQDLASFAGVATLYDYSGTGVDLEVGGQPERIRTLQVSADYFDVLRGEPILGRAFTRDEETGAPLVILSHALWRALGEDPSLVGSTLRLDGASHEVLGVMPPGFRDPVVGDVDAWTPEDLRPGGRNNPGNHYLSVIARLAPGVTLERAGQEMAALDAALADRWPEQSGYVSTLVPLQEDVVADARPLLRLLLGAVGLVLLLACMNVAGLLTVRATARRGELALRAALGAGRLRIARQLLVESLVLAFLGGAAGLALAPLLLDALVELGSTAIPRTAEVTLGAPVLLFTSALALASGLVFGTVPALRAARWGEGRALTGSARGASTERASVRLRSGLVVVQVALALVLLSGATVLATSLHRLRAVDLGVRTEGILTFELNLPAARYDAAARARLHAELSRRLAALPGVEAAGATSRLPATGNYHNWGTHPLTGPFAGQDVWTGAQQRVVAGDYFAAMAIDVVAGRGFDARDDAGAPARVVIGRSAAEALFPGVPAVGQRLETGPMDWEVIGVVEDVAVTPEGEGGLYVYHAHSQFAADRNWNLTHVVAAAVTAMGLLADVRAEVAELDDALVVHRPRTMAEALGRGRSQRSFAFALVGAFAALALTLALLGIYGVVSFAVAQRTREIGIRMALGADAAGVRGMILRQGMAVTAAGLVLGLAGSAAASRLLGSLVFETDPADPVLLGATSAALLLGALAAVWLPARRATRVAPGVVLGGE